MSQLVGWDNGGGGGETTRQNTWRKHLGELFICLFSGLVSFGWFMFSGSVSFGWFEFTYSGLIFYA